MRSHLKPVDGSGAAESDLLLLQRIRGGDERALDHLMARYWSALNAYLDRIVQNPDVAEELVQEVFVRVWAKRESWGLQGSLRGLLFQIGRRLALDERKLSRRRLAFILRPVAQGPVPTPVDLLDQSELEQAVDRAVAALPERRRLAFLMARWEGLSHRQIADALGISVQTVANQLTAALADLRSALLPFLLPPGR